MNIDDLTVGQAKELAQLFTPLPFRPPPPDPAAPWRIGAIYLIRTVTMIDTGKLVEVTPTELVLEGAAWIADTGRFSEALKRCEFGEIEPFPEGRVIIGRGSIIDAVEISTQQRSQK